MHRDPPRGFGYKVQGELMRAYAYDLPPGFYNSPLGPNTANISVLAGETSKLGCPVNLEALRHRAFRTRPAMRK